MSDCEAPSFYKAEERVAAKDYRCCECVALILKGEKHVVCKGSWGDGIKQYREHEVCAQACEFVRDSDLNDGECLAFGELLEFCGNADIIGRYARRKDENVQTLRILLAKIRRRERTGKTPPMTCDEKETSE